MKGKTHAHCRAGSERLLLSLWSPVVRSLLGVNTGLGAVVAQAFYVFCGRGVASGTVSGAFAGIPFALNFPFIFCTR